MSDQTIKIKTIESSSVTLDELSDKGLGLYIPLHRLTEDQKAKLAELLNSLDFEPVALAHSAATDD